LGLQFGEDKADLVADLLNNSYKRDIRNFSRTYGVLGFIKNHIPVSSNNVFYVTNQTELFYGYKSGPSETRLDHRVGRLPLPMSIETAKHPTRSKIENRCGLPDQVY